MVYPLFDITFFFFFTDVSHYRLYDLGRKLAKALCSLVTCYASLALILYFRLVTVTELNDHISLVSPFLCSFAVC